MESPLVTYLKRFRPISPEEQNFIEKAFEKRNYQEGEDLFKSGKVCKERFFILEGVLRILVTNEKGNEVTHFFLKENQFCTILNSFENDVVASETIQAACNSEVLAINKKKLSLLYEQIPYLKTLIDQITQQALLEKIQTRNTYLGLNSTTRYQLFLERQPEIASRVSLTDIASYLGITPQSLSRIRKSIV